MEQSRPIRGITDIFSPVIIYDDDAVRRRGNIAITLVTMCVCVGVC